ncbi:hypothetical protein ACE41R_11070 [Alteromonas macleodii]|uniref:hypothetical protein n=1 Tax=Alteromonas macleodii TaxID=28108 RepID=UPI003140295D
MFGLFNKRKKTDLEVLIEKDGIEYAAKRFSEVILRQLKTRDVAYQFILEEIEAASQGNEAAITFAKNSGISPLKYNGAMKNSRPEVDGPDGPQQFMLSLCMQLQPNVELVVQFRTKVVDNIMKSLSIGKYKAHPNSSDSEEYSEKNEQSGDGFSTISYLNRLIRAGVEREFVTAVSAIWFLQASNDPNTQESQYIAGVIVGTLENFLLEEAHVTDIDVFNLFTKTINESEYKALFVESQPIYSAGRKEVNDKFPPGATSIMEIYAYYANVMLKATKQDKRRLLADLQSLAQYVDEMCGLANQAEKDLF